MITKKDVLGKLQQLNKILGTDYKTDFASHYGGWNMYMVDHNNGGHYKSQFGFDYRKTTKEFYWYLCSIIDAKTS